MTPTPDLAAVGGWVAAALLVLAGVAKLRAPAGTVAALADARLPGGAGLVRALGLGEVTVGGAVLVVGGALPAAATAVVYAAFTVFVLRQRRDGAASCGCFGVERSPVTRRHVGVNVAAAVLSAGAAATGVAPVVEVLAPLGAVEASATLVLVVTAAWLVRLLLTAGAELSTAVALHPRAEGNR